MRYMMKAGILTVQESGKKLAQMKSAFLGANKTISLSDGGAQFQTDIHIMDAPPKKSRDVRCRIYTLRNDRGKVLMEAHPGYAKDDDPDAVGWPICWAPKVDHADLLIDGTAYLLVMHNTQNYSLKDQSGASVLQIMHQGISGGWIIETSEPFGAQVLCGLFLFCRYIEQENEFIVV